MKNLKQNSVPGPANANVPQPLVALWAIVDPQPSEPEVIPHAVSELATKIRDWMGCDKSRRSMNRTFATWRTRSGQKITDIIQWLNSPNTQQIFNASGAYGARIELVNALSKILSGEVAHAAFGQNKNKGRPRLPGFSRAYDAALYAEYLFRIKNYPSDDATFVAAETFNAREELVKSERTHLAIISDLDVAAQAQLSCHKHGIIP
jgi:hypothetical protein